MTAKYPSEVMLKGLPLPKEANPQRYARFQREVAACVDSDEPFYDVASIGAGMKHIALVTSEGQLICAGSNAAGQIGQPVALRGIDGEGEGVTAHAQNPRPSGPKGSEQHFPYYYDLEYTKDEAPNAVACGASFTLFYRKASPATPPPLRSAIRGLRTREGHAPLGRVVAMGTNVMGQLGLGHKETSTNADGLAEWPPELQWLDKSSAAAAADGLLGIREIVCGTNHSMLCLTDGSIYGFGSNLFGELARGDTTSPMFPSKITFFQEKGLVVKKVACGRSTTYFLLSDGRVYGCGASRQGQLPENECWPVPVPVTRIMTTGENKKLVRVKDIAAMGDSVVYLTGLDELFLQGRVEEFGLAVDYPKCLTVSQDAAHATFDQWRRSDAARAGGNVSAKSCSRKIKKLVSCPTACFVVYESGCIGANADGQLALPTPDRKFYPPAEFSAVIPLFAPTRDVGADHQVQLACGAGFCLMSDHGGMYDLPSHDLCADQGPIELPPPAKMAKPAAPSPGSTGPRRKIRL